MRRPAASSFRSQESRAILELFAVYSVFHQALFTYSHTGGVEPNSLVRSCAVQMLCGNESLFFSPFGWALVGIFPVDIFGRSGKAWFFPASLDSALAVAWVVSIWSSFGPLELENDLFVFGIAKTEKLMFPGKGRCWCPKKLTKPRVQVLFAWWVMVKARICWAKIPRIDENKMPKL